MLLRRDGWLFLMRARVRLAWAVLTGAVETKRSLGELLYGLTWKEFAAQEAEIERLREENAALRAQLVQSTPYRD